MKHTAKVTVLAAALVLLVGTAASAVDINLYGASAQYLFWNDAADDFLIDRGCTGVEQAHHTDGDGKHKHGITKGTCSEGTVYIRYSSKASYDGIYSCKGEVPPDGQPTCAASGPRYREMAEESTVVWAGAPPAMGDVVDLSCQEVGIGASDVNGLTFGQTSAGEKKGHLGGGWITRGISSIDTTGMTFYRPLVVPFGFFANKAANLTNLSRLQALMIFSGKAFVWSDFGPTYENKDVIACLRHAGSGTHATLDAAVMRGDWPLVYEQDDPWIWFNDGSSDEMKCIDQNGGESTAGYAAIGYADADYLAGHSGYTNVDAIMYQGQQPLKDNIKYCNYNFWSAQWLFECDPGDTTLHPLISELAAFASDASNLPASKATWWATQGEMECEKANDFAMPQFK
jgi:hypothetical protein